MTEFLDWISPNLASKVEKGGAGSGFFARDGHVGIVGHQGGSAHEGSGISSVLEYGVNVRQCILPPYGGISPKRLKADFDDAMSSIDKVHNVPSNLTQIGTKITSRGNERASFARYAKTGCPAWISLTKTINVGDDVEGSGSLAITHEVGHYLYSEDEYKTSAHSLAIFGNEKSVLNVLKIIKQTDGIKMFESMLRGDTSKTQDFRIFDQDTGEISTQSHVLTSRQLRYYLEGTEMFARAYAQYVSIKSKNKSSAKAVEIESGMNGIKRKNETRLFCSTQWKKEDFKPVIKAFDKLFGDAGWSVK